MSTIHIAYYKGMKHENPKARIVDRTVCFFTQSRFSHCELVCDYSEQLKTGLCFSASPRDGGVRSKMIDFGTGHWEVYQISTHKTKYDIVEFFDLHHGKPYDWIGAIGAAIPIFEHNPKRWFCSEIIAECLDFGAPWLYTPGDLHRYFDRMSNRVL